MNKEKLTQFIKLYRKTEKTVCELRTDYGIDLQNSKFSNFYNNYNLLIHILLVELYGEQCTDMIEDCVFESDTDDDIEGLYTVLKVYKVNEINKIKNS